MCAALRVAIYDAIEQSKGICIDDDFEIIAEDIYRAIAPLIHQIQELRLNQRVYFATKTKVALERAIQSEKILDAYIGTIDEKKEVQSLQTLIF